MTMWLPLTLCLVIFTILFNEIRSLSSQTFEAGYEDQDLTTSTSCYLFDLNSDPYESVDLYGSEDYASLITDLEIKREYWSRQTIDENVPDTTDMTNTWDTCGRVCPWIDDSSTKSKPARTVEQIYSYADAPHVVFVLVDDWGYNDLGKRSTYLSWTTPTIDSLADEGILLENYYTNELCSPSRASLLTGRYSLRLGVYASFDELPSTECTLAEELKSAGYQTYMVGKWHLGQSTTSLMPTSRGFDYFYGYLNGYESYWDKEYQGYLDLWEDDEYVTDSDELDNTYHSAYLYQDKAEAVIESHYNTYGSGSDTPMFLYYAMQLIHYPWTAPAVYLSRCMDMTNDDKAYIADDASYSTGFMTDNYCAMNLMMDEAIANLTCTLEKYGFSNNTIMIIAGDNGGEKTMDGNNYPFKGHKDSAMRGAFSTTAIIHGTTVPSSIRGSKYYHNFHVTDWLPTIMHLATDGEWTGSYVDATIDGVNQWKAMTTSDSTSPRSEMVFLSHTDGSYIAQLGHMKYIYHLNTSEATYPSVYFTEDYNSDDSYTLCTNPSLVDSSESVFAVVKPTLYQQIFGYNPAVISMDGMSLSFIFVAALATIFFFAVGLLVTYRTTSLAGDHMKNRNGKQHDDGAFAHI